jgi:YidC/Oxa1 family membrane protein insertase
VKEMSDQVRAVIAAALALIVIFAWSLLTKAPHPPSSGTTATTQATAAAPAKTTAPAAAAKPAPVTPKATPPVAASGEQTIVVESDLYRVVLSNRGAVVRSWQLKKYTDEQNHTLDVVIAEVARQTGGWPLSLYLPDATAESEANQGLYEVTSAGGAKIESGQATLQAPVEIAFHWSDGQIEVTKRLKFDRSYVTGLDISVRENGRLVTPGVAWRSGFGDVTAYRAALQMTVFYDQGGSISTIATKNVGQRDQRSAMAEQPGSFSGVGIEDLYFAGAFLPQLPPLGRPLPADLTLTARQLGHDFVEDGKTQHEILPEMAVSSTASGPLALRLFVGPKDLDTLKAIQPPLNGLVQFGWTTFIAEPLFYILLWMHRYISNYGWAIVVLTIVINMVLYPLKLKSWRSMQKMQKVAPEIRSIQDRYKKYSMRDPRKQEMNKEVMAVYSREGINPMGSCLPTLVQLPIWWGLYRMLTVTIELRHAPWIGWIHDLSARDPYYILPIAMALLMWAAQKMTPMTVTDPSQQRMMNLMPVLFGGMFIVFPISSGLVLYILASNVVAIVQQWYLNRTSPLKPATTGRGKKK